MGNLLRMIQDLGLIGPFFAGMQFSYRTLVIHGDTWGKICVWIERNVMQSGNVTATVCTLENNHQFFFPFLG